MDDTVLDIRFRVDALDILGGVKGALPFSEAMFSMLIFIC